MFKLGSKIEIKVLEYFFVNEHAKKYINELAKILDVNPANLDKKLKNLEKEGILSAELNGRQKYYFLNKNYHLLKEVKKIFNTKYGLEHSFQNELRDIENLEEAYIFGSYANKNFGQESDIDLLLVGDHSSLDAKRKILKIKKNLRREINIIDLTKKQLEKRKKNKDEFILNIFSNKLIKLI